jgi:hypothetical protein
MKINYALTLAALGLAACFQPAQAQLVIPSDGSDGAFEPGLSPTNVVIDLSQAVPGMWSANNSANAGRGIYDSNKWAVVFKYSSVNIPAGVTVSFKNHPTHAPVVWLVQGDVTVNGNVNLNGADGAPAGVLALTPTEPGPGGFRGGASGPQGSGAGMGPGGAPSQVLAGGYITQYGNPGVLPLIGGSGGGGSGGSAGGAGGSVLIGSSGTITVTGGLYATGGNRSANTTSGGGSGGAVRLIGSLVLGSGEINCLGGAGHYSGEAGRIRIESPVLAASLRTYPETIAVPPATPPLIWAPEQTTPTVRVVSVDTFAAPADPTAPLVSSADVAIQNDLPAVVMLETKNFPIEGVVQVRAAQKWGSASWIRAWYVSGDQATAQWRATNTFVKGYTTLQARATAP